MELLLSLLLLDACFFDNVAVLLHFSSDIGAELFRGEITDGEALVCEDLHRFFVLKKGFHILCNPFSYLRGHTFGSENSEPGRQIKILQTDLIRSWHVRQEGLSFWPRYE